MSHSEAAIELAPGGVLRVALNLGNPNLVRRASTSTLSGVAVDLATELAQRYSLPLQLRTFSGAGAVVEAVSMAVWDVAFLASDPSRERELSFTPPYLTLSGAFAVRSASQLRTNDDVDQTAVRIVVGRGSAYDLYLSKTIQRASLVRVAETHEVIPAMLRNGYEVAAGVRPQLAEQLLRFPNLRLLDGRFMSILQAAAVPKGRTHALALLSSFMEAMKSSGFVQRALVRHEVEGAELPYANPAGR